MKDDEQKGQYVMAQSGVSVWLIRPLLSSIDERMVSITIDWFRFQSFFGGQKTSIAVGIQPCGTEETPAAAG